MSRSKDVRARSVSISAGWDPETFANKEISQNIIIQRLIILGRAVKINVYDEIPALLGSDEN